MTIAADRLVDEGPRGASSRSGPGSVRSDIQGLRALAVSLVLVFHLWPRGLTGGFVGVDVFFVISGFLITSHLLAHPPEAARDLATFWARRIQRLLPASLLVLAASTVATLLVGPATLWGDTAASVRAAALYVVNWRLAATSVDYLAAEASPTPVQHYWSLSVEEQFYLFWPILLLVLVWLARRGRGGGARVGVAPRRDVVVVVSGLTAVLLASLAWSVVATATEPSAAYFVTPTRIWELGSGGLLAALLSRRAFGRTVDHEHVRIPESARAAVAWLGLAAVAWAAVTYSGDTPFPGWRALLPVLGTVAVLAVDAPLRSWSPGRWMALAPVQRLGDMSYSVYLWHWPLIVLVPYATGRDLVLPERLAIVLATLALAVVTKVCVEDPFRSPRWRRTLVRPYLAMVAGMAVVVTLAAGLSAWDDHQRAAAKDLMGTAVAQGGACFGAAALSGPNGRCPRTTAGPTVPAPVEAVHDKSDAYQDACWEWIPFNGLRTCTYGSPDASVSIALVGNSHAGHWLPALQRVAQKRDWRITTLLASECTATRTEVAWDTPEKARGCLGWTQRVLDYTGRHHFDLVVTAERSGRQATAAKGGDSRPEWRAGYAAVLRAWVDQNQRVVVLHDTPFPASTGINPPECIAEHEDDLTRCSGPRDAWVPDDQLAVAVGDVGSPLVSMVDLTDHICGPDTCDAAVGGVTTYFDGSHLTATFGATLAPYLGAALGPLVTPAHGGQ